MYDKKYIVEKIEEFGEHNDLYNDIEGRVCYPAYFKVGERGWFLYEISVFMAHRIHTSVVKNIEYINDLIIVATQNTKFTFRLVKD